MENNDDEEVIRQKMQEARNSLTEKLETLEDSVVGTVSETADKVKETVETVKEAVQETTETVKDTVQEGVEAVRSWFDITGHVRQYPWLMMAGSMGVGFFLETIVSPAPTAPPEPARKAAAHNGHGRAHHGDSATREKRRAEVGGLSSWLGAFAPEISKLKSMAIGALFGAVRSMIVDTAPAQMKSGLSEIFESAARKLVGEPIPGMEAAPSPTSSEGEHHERDKKRNPAEMGRPLGPTRWTG